MRVPCFSAAAWEESMSDFFIFVKWNNWDTVPFTGACHADELLYLFVNSNMDTLLTETDRQVFGVA
jgi:hypothetical protein